MFRPRSEHLRLIQNADLTLSDIPVPDADINEIGCFALTFDGYEHWGAFEKCAEVANAERQNTLTDLRTCLFFEQRRWRHSGYGPDEEAEAYWRSLVAKIRARVEAGDLG